MKKNLIFFALLLIANLNLCLSQSFQNGDLEGTVGELEFGLLPIHWQNVPFDDANCLACCDGYDTPNLISLNAPMISFGLNGNPFSGITFISGGFFMNSNPFGLVQEGIMQTVSGFIVENIYKIRFHQTVVKTNSTIDNSGSWAVYIDTVLIGVTASTYSNEAFDSNNLPWEPRSVEFTAKSTSHLIKFLPMDNDTNYTVSYTDTLGALFMGIDSIGLSVVTDINEINNNLGLEVFPNPAKQILHIKSTNPIKEIEIYDTQGQLKQTTEPPTTLSYTISIENFKNGLYIFKFKNGDEVVYKRVVVLN